MVNPIPNPSLASPIFTGGLVSVWLSSNDLLRNPKLDVRIIPELFNKPYQSDFLSILSRNFPINEQINYTKQNSVASALVRRFADRLFTLPPQRKSIGLLP